MYAWHINHFYYDCIHTAFRSSHSSFFVFLFFDVVVVIYLILFMGWEHYIIPHTIRNTSRHRLMVLQNYYYVSLENSVSSLCSHLYHILNCRFFFIFWTFAKRSLLFTLIYAYIWRCAFECCVWLGWCGARFVRIGKRKLKIRVKPNSFEHNDLIIIVGAAVSFYFLFFTFFNRHIIFIDLCLSHTLPSNGRLISTSKRHKFTHL